MIKEVPVVSYHLCSLLLLGCARHVQSAQQFKLNWMGGLRGQERVVTKEVPVEVEKVVFKELSVPVEVHVCHRILTGNILLYKNSCYHSMTASRKVIVFLLNRFSISFPDMYHPDCGYHGEGSSSRQGGDQGNTCPCRGIHVAAQI